MEEQDKRDQDVHEMHIFNRWNGYGISEVNENMVCWGHVDCGLWLSVADSGVCQSGEEYYVAGKETAKSLDDMGARRSDGFLSQQRYRRDAW